MTEALPATGPWWRPDRERALRLVGGVTTATAGRVWWAAGAALLILGGTAAALHPPAGDTFAQIATGKLIASKGLGATSSFMAGPAGPLDLRSWLLDLGLSWLYGTGGVAFIEAAGAVAGALIGALMFVAIRCSRVSHPLAAMVVGGIALLALYPLLTSLSADLLAILTLLLLLCLLGLREGLSGSAVGLVLLMVVWANHQPQAVLVAPLLAVVLALALTDRARRRVSAGPPLWLLPGVLLAVCVNPRGPLIYAQLPLDLGMGGGHGYLSGWSSPNFHPLTARMAELAGLLLIFGYTMAGRRLRRQDSGLGLLGAVLSLLWSAYLPLFLSVAAVQGAEYLGDWLDLSRSAARPPRPAQVATRPRALAWVLVPALLGLLFLARASLEAKAAGGPQGQLSRQLPVGTSTWLASHGGAGTWYTTAGFGDYLAARFPTGGRLVCTSDPVATGARRLGECQRLAVLNQGAGTVLEHLKVGLAVLPPRAPEVAFLTAEGWRIRYRGEAAVVLSPSRL